MLRLIFIIFCLIPFFSKSQPLKLNNEHKYYHLGIEQGLSNNDVNCLLQSKDGFMWIGTFDGLNRYDGYRLEYFRKELSKVNSLPNNRIESIFETNQGNLLISTLDGIVWYSPMKNIFESIKIGGNISPGGSAIIRQFDSKIYLATNKYGLLCATDEIVYVYACVFVSSIFILKIVFSTEIDASNISFQFKVFIPYQAVFLY